MCLAGLAEPDRRRVLAGAAVQLGLLALLCVEHVVRADNALGLIEPDIVRRVAIGAMAVIHRPAECRPFFRVAVAADGQVVAGDNEGVLLAVLRFAEEDGAGALEGAAAVPLAVAADSLITVIAAGNRLDDALDQLLLWFGVRRADFLAENRRVVHAQARRQAFFGAVV